MKLSHFSPDPINKIYSLKQEVAKSLYAKPKGLWLSVDGEDDWPTWNETEGFRDTSEQYHYAVSVRENANILCLSSEDQILSFHSRYKIPNPDEDLFLNINWREVANDYQGIIIAPYCWELRLDPRVHWYNTWDCASGCIWNAKAIQDISLIREPIKDAA